MNDGMTYGFFTTFEKASEIAKKLYPDIELFSETDEIEWRDKHDRCDVTVFTITINKFYKDGF